MKMSSYSNIFEKEQYTLVHNPLHNTMLKITDPSLITIIKELKKQNMNLEVGDLENVYSEFYDTLKKLNIIIEDNINEENILNLRYNNKI